VRASLTPLAVPFNPVVTATSGTVRGYGLRHADELRLYLVHADTHDRPIQATVTLDAPVAGLGVWTDPATGTVLAYTRILPGQASLTSPPFSIDVAFALRRDTGAWLYLPLVDGG
jgi:hypothetical protein